jgi:nitrate reductase gamma subunit
MTLAIYVFVAAVPALISRRLCERDRAALSRRVDNISLIVTAAILLALNVVMISNAVISK